MRWLIYGAIQERHLTTSLAAALREAGHDVEVIDGVASDYVVEPDDEVAAEAARRISDALPADVLFCIRTDEPAPAFVRSLRDRGTFTIAWFLDDPLNYASIYARVAEAYDLTLHTGAEDVLALYEERHGIHGYQFPFYTDDHHYPSVYDPETADIDLGFLGNAAGPREIERYALLASLPFEVRMFGRLARRAEDWAGILGGYLSEDRIPATLARFKVAFNVAQPFDETIEDKYGWPGVGRFHEFFFPSRLIALAAAGIPTVSLQHPAMPRPLASTIVVRSRVELIEAVRALLADEPRRRAISRRARDEFEAHLTAAARVRMLEQLVAGPRDHDRSARATLWRSFGPPIEPVDPLGPAGDGGTGPIMAAPFEQRARTRVLVVGRAIEPGSAVGGLVLDADAAGVEIVALDLHAVPGIAHDPFAAPIGEGPVTVEDRALLAVVERAAADAVVFVDGCVPSEKAAAEVRARGAAVLGLWIHGEPAETARFDRVARAAGIDPDAPPAALVPGVRIRGGHPEVASGMRWRLGARATEEPATIEVFLDQADPAEVLASLGRGSLPIVLGADPPHAVGAASPARALGAAMFYDGRATERIPLVEQLRARAVVADRWASRWTSILAGVRGDAARPPRPRVIAIGHWGRGNLGDDLLAEALLASVPCDASIVTYDPAGAVRAHGTPAIHINDLERIEAALSVSAALVIGGGGLLHDLTFRAGGRVEDVFGGSRKMLPRMARIAAIARALDVPVALDAIGVGPLETAEARRIVRFLCEIATVVSVRDAASVEQLRACGYDGSVVLAADPVLLLEPAAPGPRGHLAVSVRPWPDAPPGLYARIADALDQIASSTGAPVVFVPFEQRDAADARASETVASLMRTPATIHDGDARAAIAGARSVLAMRLHASILAARAGIPCVGLAYDPKVGAFYDEIGSGEQSLPLDASAGAIAEAVLAARPATAARIEALRARAADGMRAVASVIGEPRPRRARDVTAFEAAVGALRRQLEG